MPGKTYKAKIRAQQKKKLETPLEELCLKLPPEFLEYMLYCRQLKFKEEPDYAMLIAKFENCMKRNNMDPKVTNDFAWKGNQLSKDKQALKNSINGVINK